jgi:hypothetical protein
MTIVSIPNPDFCGMKSTILGSQNHSTGKLNALNEVLSIHFMIKHLSRNRCATLYIAFVIKIFSSISGAFLEYIPSIS